MYLRIYWTKTEDQQSCMRLYKDSLNLPVDSSRNLNKIEQAILDTVYISEDSITFEIYDKDNKHEKMTDEEAAKIFRKYMKEYRKNNEK